MFKFGRRHGAVYQNAEGMRSCDDGVDNAYVTPSDGDSLEDDEDFADFDDFDDDDELPAEVNQNDSGFQSSPADTYEQPNSQLFRYYRSEISADGRNGQQANSKESSAVVDVRKTGRPTMPPPPLPSQRLALLHAEAESIPNTTPPPLPLSPFACSFDDSNVKSKALILEQLLKTNGKALTPPPERRARGLLELLSQSRRHASLTLPDAGVAVVQHQTQANSSAAANLFATHPRCLPGGTTKRLKSPSPPVELRINSPPPPPPPISMKPPNLANSRLRPLPIEPPNRKFSTPSAGQRSFEKTNLTCSETNFRRPSRRAVSEAPVAVGRTPSSRSISGPISIVASTNTALSKPIAQIYPNSRTSSSADKSAQDVEQKVDLDQKPWFHGIIDRKEAERRLRVMPLNGTFLVRQHRDECAERPFVMSVYYGGKCYHSYIRKKSNGQFAAGQYTKPMEEEFESVESLVAYYRDMDLCLLNRENPNKVSCATLLTLAAPKNST